MKKQQDDAVIKSIKHSRKLPDGIYIRGTVQGYPILYTADTGASKTVLSKRVYDNMRPEDKPPLTKSAKLVGAGGTNISEVGKGNFEIQLGPVKVETEAIVAEIDDDGLLGVDVLQNREDGPTDLLMSKGVLKMAGKEVPIIQVGVTNRTRRVTAADHSVIPAQSEAIIDVYIERKEYDDFSSESEYIIEPTQHFQEEYPLQMASTLVDINQGCTCKVRLLNPFPTPVSIKQDAVLGKAELIEGKPRALLQEEDTKERGNYSNLRRIVLVKDDIERSNQAAEHTRKVKTKVPGEIPDHLRGLYEKSSAGLDTDERVKLKTLLLKFQDSFSKNEWDLGLTHLTAHPINTGSAEPVKQPPRRVPLAYADAEKQAIEDLKAKGVIRPSVSPWASPIVLVR
ncbi:MAG: retroviral-like aspartic protease family protein, partial [Candidatus Thiodiazotropha endolucinida]|nr:retroviral-like aspartic protease family protein [Candidatus Thiodiazotropha taylori]MCW4346361.1 retroviral-like aspartic protease family protein [Candidatus Thiodiazotropha endolucinida]